MISVHHTVVKNNTSKNINLGTFVLASGVTVVVPSHFIKANKAAVIARRSRQIELIPIAKYKGGALSLAEMNKLLDNPATDTVVIDVPVEEKKPVEVETPVVEETPETVAEVVTEAVTEEATVAEEDTDEDEDAQSTDSTPRKRVRKPPLKK